MLQIFVYGTLKRGYWNHARYCAGHVAAREATVPGRLYVLPSGIPVMTVPDEAVLATGGPQPRREVAEQVRIGQVLERHPDLAGAVAMPEAWGPVVGELLTFDDPEVRLPALDRLEGFVPGAPGLYQRVLLAVTTDDGPAVAWTYVGSAAIGSYVASGIWPAPCAQ